MGKSTKPTLFRDCGDFDKQYLESLAWREIQKLKSLYKSEPGLAGRMTRDKMTNALLRLSESRRASRRSPIKKNRSTMQKAAVSSRSLSTPTSRNREPSVRVRTAVPPPVTDSLPLPPPPPVATPSSFPPPQRRPRPLPAIVATPQTRVFSAAPASGGSACLAPPTPQLPPQAPLESAISFHDDVPRPLLGHFPTTFRNRALVREREVNGTTQYHFYSGAVVDSSGLSLCHGQGMATVELADGSILERYRGNFQNGQYHGLGHLTDYVLRLTFDGEFRDHRPFLGKEKRWKPGRLLEEGERPAEESEEWPFEYVYEGPMLDNGGIATLQTAPSFRWEGRVETRREFVEAKLVWDSGRGWTSEKSGKIVRGRLPRFEDPQQTELEIVTL